ncbi:MAG: aspartate aminotransferase family protein [Massiliimalia sp.]|jgi:acetylornithine/N-succinyldiaminopimelate aminotransferase
MSHIKDLDQSYIVGTYARFDAVLSHGKGSTCWDEDGKKYIDFTSGIGVNSLGFSNDAWAGAVCRQVCNLQHVSNLYYTAPDALLAEKLTKITGYAKVFFANSGAEANEGAIKVARKYSFDRYGEGRNTIITLVNSFHGRTVTTLAATGQDVFHNYFYPFTEGFRYAQANSMESVLEQMDDTVCAVMYEHVQGEGGVLPLTPAFVHELADYCREKDILLIADEVQTGVGRTGKFLASEYFDVQPDLTTLAKGLGGGLPIGAVLCNEKTKDVFGYGDHGTTFGGNPVACAGAGVCVDTISNPDFLSEVCRKAEWIRGKLSSVPEVKSITGLGMMIGLELAEKSAKEVAAECLKHGLMVLTAKTKVRLLPPLNITQEELEEGIGILIQVLEQK